jgi:hypothetical protein
MDYDNLKDDIDKMTLQEVRDGLFREKIEHELAREQLKTLQVALRPVMDELYKLGVARQVRIPEPDRTSYIELATKFTADPAYKQTPEFLAECVVARHLTCSPEYQADIDAILAELRAERKKQS